MDQTKYCIDIVTFLLLNHLHLKGFDNSIYHILILGKRTIFSKNKRRKKLDDQHNKARKDTTGKQIFNSFFIQSIFFITLFKFKKLL